MVTNVLLFIFCSTDLQCILIVCYCSQSQLTELQHPNKQVFQLENMHNPEQFLNTRYKNAQMSTTYNLQWSLYAKKFIVRLTGILIKIVHNLGNCQISSLFVLHLKKYFTHKTIFYISPNCYSYQEPVLDWERSIKLKGTDNPHLL